MTGRALVSGATGFTGRRLVDRLLAEGWRVRALARRSPADLPQGVEVLRADLTRPFDWDPALEEVDVVFHLAAAYREAGIPRAHYRAVNFEAAHDLFDAARRTASTARIVHCSTIGVHGDVGRSPADEDSPYAPGDPYQVAKAEADALALRLARDENANIVVARPAAIYGPGDRRLLKLFRMVDRGIVVLVGKADIFYHPVYVDDLVEGLLRCGAEPKARGRAYILGEPRYYRLREIFDHIAAALGRSYRVIRLPLAPVRLLARLTEAVCVPLRIEPPLHPRRVEFYTKSRAFRVERAERELGFRAQVVFPEGAARTIEAHRKLGDLAPDS